MYNIKLRVSVAIRDGLMLYPHYFQACSITGQTELRTLLILSSLIARTPCSMSHCTVSPSWCICINLQ